MGSIDDIGQTARWSIVHMIQELIHNLLILIQLVNL